MRKFLTKLPPLSDQQWRLLGVLSLAAIFGSYSQALLPLALPQIQTTLAVPTAQLGVMGAIIRLGALPAFGFAVGADLFGRRRLLFIAMIAYVLLTGATAFAPTVMIFVAAQFGMRLFVTVTAIIANVMIIEEFPANARGWGIGVYTALASVGGGTAAVCFAAVDLLPGGWRALYLVGLLALGVVGLWRTHLPETSRFQAQWAKQSILSWRSGLAAPLTQLITTYPRRLLVIGAVVLLVNLGGDAALFYDPTYLQQRHGWQPWQIALLNLGAGFMALLGSAVAGRVSDRAGRKRATSGFLLTMPLFIIAYYHADGWRLPLFWAGLLFTSIGATVTLSALSSELFPTAYRSTAAGAMAVIATFSGALSLLAHSFLHQAVGSPWSAVSLLALLLLFTPLLIAYLPETSGRPLEEIAPE